MRTLRKFNKSISLALTLWLAGCDGQAEMEAEAKSGNVGIEATPQAAEKASAETNAPAGTSPSKAAPVNKVVLNGFYQIKDARPAQVCGAEGFAYLWQGYLVPECGGCHYAGNKFNVSAFANAPSLDTSYSVMSSIVNRQTFVEATKVNPFCIKCILKPEDPLAADLAYFAQNVRTCPTASATP